MYDLRSAIKNLDLEDALEFALEAYEHIAGQDVPIDLVVLNDVFLTPKERVIFGILYANLGELVQYSRIFDVLSHGDERGMTRNTLNSHMTYLRTKLAGQYTVRVLHRVGYVMERCGG